MNHSLFAPLLNTDGPFDVEHISRCTVIHTEIKDGGNAINVTLNIIMESKGYYKNAYMTFRLTMADILAQNSEVWTKLPVW